MLCIDDSKSVRSNNAEEMTCEALALISKALSQLEVGELAILSFGNTVNLLHPFEEPFTAAFGPKVRLKVKPRNCSKQFVPGCITILFRTRQHKHSSLGRNSSEITRVSASQIRFCPSGIHANCVYNF